MSGRAAAVGVGRCELLGCVNRGFSAHELLSGSLGWEGDVSCPGATALPTLVPDQCLMSSNLLVSCAAMLLVEVAAAVGGMASSAAAGERRDNPR
jgi:hypothetical protein